MDEVKFKSDKHCIECRSQTRKDIIAEVREACGGCKKINNVEHEKNHKQAKKRHGRWR